jgi:hypothetical protein
MSATGRITLVKASPYKTETAELWSNSYHFTGTLPANATDWTALANALWALEGAFITNDLTKTHLVHGYGYAAASDVATWSGDFTSGGTIPGTVPVGDGFTDAGQGRAPIQVCVLLRMRCGTSSSTGRPRYVMKYIHDVLRGAADVDHVADISGAGTAKLGHFIDGTLPGSFAVCAPDGTPCTAVQMAPYLTTHQIKRRGKRPRRGA